MVKVRVLKKPRRRRVEISSTSEYRICLLARLGWWGGRFFLEQGLQLTPRLEMDFEVEYDTQWEGKIGMYYLVARNFSLIANWHSEYAIGAGIRILF